ncbi:hypothetical protein [Dyadobacter sp. CY326]|uniref:hypothetical protein n=1 Tax=Dyadobacter sp. CY326 TaxID=2907300 RepID=UPI001F3D198E|nr:hypothetical protein [Dyadobacter sp. CY326]MCE7064553.1 hypothetical protein [Dyadobacter sp. CY326]
MPMRSPRSKTVFPTACSFLQWRLFTKAISKVIISSQVLQFRLEWASARGLSWIKKGMLSMFSAHLLRPGSMIPRNWIWVLMMRNIGRSFIYLPLLLPELEKYNGKQLTSYAQAVQNAMNVLLEEVRKHK